jgi:hypothetical protein
VCVLFARCLELKRDTLRQLSCEQDATSKHGRQFVLIGRRGEAGELVRQGKISLRVDYNVQPMYGVSQLQHLKEAFEWISCFCLSDYRKGSHSLLAFPNPKPPHTSPLLKAPISILPFDNELYGFVCLLYQILMLNL